MMAALRYLASASIDAFGITHPSPQARDHAARYIALLILTMLAGVIVTLSAVLFRL